MNDQSDIDNDIEKDFAALEHMRRARLAFEIRIQEASATQTADVLETLRLDSMFDFAEFFFAIEAMGLKDRGDIAILADLHDQRLIGLLKDRTALRRRGLRDQPLLKAIFSADVRPRLEALWHTEPGSFDQSNLARFLITQMSPETTRNLTIASHSAGFMTRARHSSHVMVVKSTGVMERIFARCMRDMRMAIAQL